MLPTLSFPKQCQSQVHSFLVIHRILVGSSSSSLAILNYNFTDYVQCLTLEYFLYYVSQFRVIILYMSWFFTLTIWAFSRICMNCLKSVIWLPRSCLPQAASIWKKKSSRNNFFSWTTLKIVTKWSNAGRLVVWLCPTERKVLDTNPGWGAQECINLTFNKIEWGSSCQSRIKCIATYIWID